MLEFSGQLCHARVECSDMPRARECAEEDDMLELSPLTCFMSAGLSQLFYDMLFSLASLAQLL
jgi:hypothetical protein